MEPDQDKISLDGFAVVLPLNIAINEDIGRFLVGLAGEISSNFSQGIQIASQGFSAQLTNLSTAIGAQGVSQVVGLFDGDSSKY